MNDEKIRTINAVEGFAPEKYAVDYTDLETGETRKRLPVMAQVAWFRLKYPEGRFSLTVQAGKDCFAATARVYMHYNDPPEHFLSEATASRGFVQDKPTISPREWAQTAALGIALRNAGFGLQFHTAGESFDAPAADELGGEGLTDKAPAPKIVPKPVAPAVLTYETALTLQCPIAKYTGKTLGDLVTLDPGALAWIATKFTGEQRLRDGATLICERALAA
jgi:hypothetical protein